MKFYNSYFIFGGSQDSLDVFSNSGVLGFVICFTVCTYTYTTKHVLWYLLGTSVCGIGYVFIGGIEFQRYMKYE